MIACLNSHKKIQSVIQVVILVPDGLVLHRLPLLLGLVHVLDAALQFFRHHLHVRWL